MLFHRVHETPGMAGYARELGRLGHFFKQLLQPMLRQDNTHYGRDDGRAVQERTSVTGVHHSVNT
jgi:hypothetical protein